jgi:hypothetical protein
MGGESYGRWNPFTEDGFLNRLGELNDPHHAESSRGPLSSKKWRDLMRGLKDARHLKENIERWSKEFIKQHT